ncbi:MAG: alpha-glucan family phosphorylase [Nitrospinota bacterium]|nr:alpha-glucan family phosphorylase [Nitrospinota bacterium]
MPARNPLHISPEEERKKRESGCINDDHFFGFPANPVLEAEKVLQSSGTKSVAYFSMEFGLAPSIYNAFECHNGVDERNFVKPQEVFSNMRAMDYYHLLKFGNLIDLPIYSGGLGVLAGDMLKSAADLGVSMVGVGVLWNKGYFKQRLWYKYGQVPEETRWDPYSYPGLVLTDRSVKVRCCNEDITLRIWLYPVYSHDQKHVVPLILLDSDCPENGERERQITDQLYRSDSLWWKIVQRVVLGMGGIKALDALGYSIDKYHMNEGHAAFSFIERLSGVKEKDIAKLKESFCYTCHTPVKAGHDILGLNELLYVFDEKILKEIRDYGAEPGNKEVVNLTRLAINSSGSVNAVAKKHGAITRLQFPEYADKIQSVTNGVHTFTWITEPIAQLLDKYSETIGDWRRDPKLLTNVRKMINDLPFRHALFEAHQDNKRHLISFFKHWFLKENVFTLSWARRIAPYKRPGLILSDPERLVDIARRIGPIQILMAGKAHPNDIPAFRFINDIMDKIDKLEPENKLLKIILLENYDTRLGKLLTGSVDLWLNTPLPPFEASGTSGMKAIMNGVVQLSSLDGWVVEADKRIGRIFGHILPEGEIGDDEDLKIEGDSIELYDNLEELVGLYYAREEKESVMRSEWVDMMIHCVAEAGFFNAHRMAEEYREKIWKF